MSRRTTSRNFGSKECNENGQEPKRGVLVVAVLFLLLISEKLDAAFAQNRTACDSVEAAWKHYFNNRFDHARALVADCEERRALELRVYVALKENRNDLAETIMCRLLKSAPEYQPDPSQAPVLGYAAWVEERRKCRSEAPPAVIIRSRTEVLGWLELNMGGETFVLPDDADNNPELFHLRLGFDHAEVEVGAIPIMNLPLKKEYRTQLPISAIKAKLWSEGDIYKFTPGLVFLGYFSHNALGWAHEQDAQDATYSKQVIHFALLFSKNFGPAKISAGPTYSILDLKRFTDRDTIKAHEGKTSIHAELQFAFLPSRLFMIAGAAPMPVYALERKDGALQKPYTKFLVAYGIRAFLLPHLAIDIGGGWRGFSKEELSDADKHFFRFGVTLGLSLAQQFP